MGAVREHRAAAVSSGRVVVAVVVIGCTLSLALKHILLFHIWTLFVVLWGWRRATLRMILVVALWTAFFIPYLRDGAIAIVQQILLYETPWGYGLIGRFKSFSTSGAILRYHDRCTSLGALAAHEYPRCALADDMLVFCVHIGLFRPLQRGSVCLLCYTCAYPRADFWRCLWFPHGIGIAPLLPEAWFFDNVLWLFSFAQLLLLLSRFALIRLQQGRVRDKLELCP